MKYTDNLISINILDRNYKIKCPPEEAHALREAAAHLDEQMRHASHSGGNNTAHADRIAIVTALNVCHELFLLKKQYHEKIDDLHQQLSLVSDKIQKYLAVDEEIAV